MNLSTIADMVHANAVEKGFHSIHATEDAFVEATCNNIHDEVSELHESWRGGRLHSPCDKADKMQGLGLPPLTCAEEELADIVIRACDSAKRLGIDIERAVNIKHNFNRTRPHLHGNKKS